VKAASPAVTIIISPVGVFGFPECDDHGRCRPDDRRDDLTTDAPCRAPHPHPEQHRASREEPEPFHRRLLSRTTASRPETPSADRSRSSSPVAGASGAALRTATGALRVSARPSFRCGFTRSCCALDPPRRPAIHRSVEATHRLSTSATETSASTPRTFQTPPLLSASASRRARWMATLPKESRQPDLLSPGVAPKRKSLCCDTHRDDRSSLWIYPDLSDPDTLCREQVPDTAWKSLSQATVR